MKTQMQKPSSGKSHYTAEWTALLRRGPQLNAALRALVLATSVRC